MKVNQPHLVIGGGVIGLCSAYFLAKSGHEVVVIERDDAGQTSCSDGNAGMVVPSHFIPLAAPGVITQGMKWMLNPRSPFCLKPRLDPKLWSWIWQFYRHSNERHVEGCRELLRDLNLESRRLFGELSEELGFPIARRGLLALCQTEHGLEEEAEVARVANEIGVRAEVCGSERLRELDPSVEMEAIGGVWFEQDCHMDPQQLLSALRKGIERHGGSFLHDEVVDFRASGGEVSHAVTRKGEALAVDQVTIAGGAWSPALASKLGVNLPMQAGKGYSFTLKKPKQLPELCSLLKEGRVAVTPMGDALRVAGTMEIGGNDLRVRPQRLAGIIESFCRFFPQFSPEDFEGLEPWVGLRPCSPDGLPYIGRLSAHPNVTIATGHSMMGVSLAPVTGKLVAALSERGSADARLSPQRYS